MANIALRSPQFKHSEVPATGVSSVGCTVTIDGTLRYTLIKNAAPLTSVNFDISELARDYLDIIYKSNYEKTSVTIATTLTQYSGLDGTGSVVGTPITINDVGFESYGTFVEGVNPFFEGNQIEPTVLIARNNLTTPASFTVLTPIGETGKLSSIAANGTISTSSYSSSATSIVLDTVTVEIKRIDCTKYGIGTKIIFINKFGFQQDLWFFLKKSKSLFRTNEGYKSNTITYPTDTNATYSVQNAPNKVFNTQAKQSHSLSSGYYPQFANEYFEQLLLSEFIWMERPKKYDPSTNEIIPVKVKTSSLAFKTSVNDRLIEYTIEFEEAFDYINNIR